MNNTNNLALVKKLAALDGLTVLGEMACTRDPEAGDIYKASYKDQQIPVDQTDDWNFMYPVYIQERSCMCDDEEFLKEMETDWDDEKQCFVPLANPERFFGHSYYCLDSVPDYLRSINNLLPLARKLYLNPEGEIKLAFSHTTEFASVVLKQDAVSLALLLLNHFEETSKYSPNPVMALPLDHGKLIFEPQ